ncbi:MAG TPA: hypothetical protein VJQ42_02135, partial [Rhodanobacteraceae bacterium]|nr:hypothetical protein [Rhodanobacteraceae bacterium]
MSATADDVRWPCDDGVHAVSDDGKCGSCRQPVADDTPAWRSIPGHLAWYWGTKAQGMTILPPRTAGAPPSPGCWR